MEQFTDLEDGLKRAIHEVMIGVVDICAMSIKFTKSRKWESFKSKVKVGLLSDNSVGKSIENLRQLSQAHHTNQSTQSLKLIMETKQELVNHLNMQSEQHQQTSVKIASLVASENKRNFEDVARKHLDNIKERLGITNSYKSLKDLGDSLNKDCAPKTACWFTDVPAFSRWADQSDTTGSPLLVVEGGSNTGKSVLLSSMVQHLRSRHGEANTELTRSLVAAIFFQATVGKNRHPTQPITKALKWIACQLAEQDISYARTLSQACDSQSRKMNLSTDDNHQDLWDLLGISSPRGESIHYLVFDGLATLPDESKNEKMQKLMLLATLRDKAGPRVRILVSTRPETLRGQISIQPKSIIRVEQHTNSDIKTFIEHYLKSMDLFQESDDEDLRSRIVVTLAKHADGNFNKVKAVLDKIHSAVDADASEEDIEKILEAPNMDEKHIFQTTIAQLEEKLTKSEIDELNELLIWVICGKEWFTMEELTALLFLRFQKKGTMKMQKKLFGKYSGIFGLRQEDAEVYVLDGMDEMLKTRRTQPREHDETPTYSATITITRGDIRSAQTFLWSLSQKLESASRDIYGFEQAASQHSSQAKIQVNEVDAHFTISKTAFSILAKDPCDESEPLNQYLIDYLPYHLDKLTRGEGNDQLTNKQKQVIGEGIFTIFASGECAKRHWGSYQKVRWLRDPDALNSFQKWLDDPIATSKLGILDHDWLTKVRSDANPHQALLAKVAETVAMHWLHDSAWYASDACKWLQEYFQLPAVGSRKASGQQTCSKDTQDTMEVTFHDVRRRCETLLGTFTVEDKILSFERLGEAFIEMEDPSSAIEAYSQAIAFQEHSMWTSHLGLGRSFMFLGQFDKACLETEKALRILQKEHSSTKTTDLSIAYFQQGSCYLGLNENQRGIGILKQGLELNPEDGDGNVKLLGTYVMLGRWEDAKKSLKGMLHLSQGKADGGLLGHVLEYLPSYSPSEEHTFHVLAGFFEALVGESEDMPLLMQAMRQASKKARKENRRVDLMLFLLFEGIFHYLQREKDNSHIELALDFWDKCTEVDMSSRGWHKRRMLAYGWACGHHFDQALSFLTASQEQAEVHARKMHDIIEKEASRHFTMSKTYLATYLAYSKRQIARSRQILRDSFDSALQLLFDDDEDNDWQGYYNMATVLIHSGDLINARSAFSLLLPSPDGTNVLSWILEFDDEIPQALSIKLIEMVEKDCKPRDLGSQIKFLSDHIESILSNASDPNTDEPIREGTESNQGPVSDPQPPRDTERDTKLDLHMTEDSLNIYTTNEETRMTFRQIKARLEEWEPRSRQTTFNYPCDNCLCETTWNFSKAINICIYCFETALCDECLQKQQTDGNTTLFIVKRCKKDHRWLRLPEWNREEYLHALKKEVRVGGELNSKGKWVSRSVELESEWLIKLREEWKVYS
ncbi:hypothetical protein FPRO06_13739 [Fusarium proliferatum]|nr:hypothetical protein FPRO06_13739 [Fusarium proliferatum]